MGRLIDADKCPCILCEDTRNAHCTYEHRSCKKFCDWLNNTAYDTENVVAELIQFGLNSMDKQIYDSDTYYDGVSVAIRKACNIVKRGGVE